MNLVGKVNILKIQEKHHDTMLHLEVLNFSQPLFQCKVFLQPA